MTLALSRYRLRFRMDPTSHTALTCIIQGRTPQIWRGVDCYVEIALFGGAADATFIDDLTNITSVSLEIHTSSNRSTAALVSKTIAGGSLSALTLINWNTGGAAHYHARFELSASDTNFDMTNAQNNKLQFWLVFHAVLTSGEYITLGSTVLEVEEDAAQLGIPAVGTVNASFRVKSDGVLQLLNNDTGKWHSLWVLGAATGSEKLVIGSGES